MLAQIRKAQLRSADRPSIAPICFTTASQVWRSSSGGAGSKPTEPSVAWPPRWALNSVLRDSDIPTAAGPRAADVIDLDPIATKIIIDWFGLSDAALRRLDPDQTPVLWPEHFDVAIVLDDCTFGSSRAMIIVQPLRVHQHPRFRRHRVLQRTVRRTAGRRGVRIR
jgi:hypothetical protein